MDALTRGVIQEELIQMWNSWANTVASWSPYDVDEAILLSDRILLMTNGPEARIAEVVHVSVPRPRDRGKRSLNIRVATRSRNHIIHFLVRHAKHGSSDGTSDGPFNKREIHIVKFEEPLVAH